jgi:predicted N-acetyltransferase YhbS
VSAELAAAMELDRRITRRGAESCAELSWGWDVRHRRLADVHHLNTLLLCAPLPAEVSARDLMALADARQGDLAHRHFVLDDEPAADRLAPELLEAGWERDRTLYMALRSDPRAAPIDPRARLISEEQLREVQRLMLAEDDFGPEALPGLVRQLLEAQAALRAGTTALAFGAGQGDQVASHCTLFCEADLDNRRVALIDNVGTLHAHRQQGLARATVSAAIRAAGEWGAELVVVPADADDWPQLMYAGLGFAPLGRQASFTLRVRASDSLGPSRSEG